ncbi:hypothetical protein [Paraburkholderia diazotrophica]|uniref:hypothetical protein n=1 Tax=Paraburkholderia diazotrophica TaxID=667676 RepID=UPI003170A1C6
MVQITFICHLSLIGPESVDPWLAARADAAIRCRRRRIASGIAAVSLFADAARRRVRLRGAPACPEGRTACFGSLAGIDWTNIDSNRHAASLITYGGRIKDLALCGL